MAAPIPAPHCMLYEPNHQMVRLLQAVFWNFIATYWEQQHYYLLCRSYAALNDSRVASTAHAINAHVVTIKRARHGLGIEQQRQVFGIAESGQAHTRKRVRRRRQCQLEARGRLVERRVNEPRKQGCPSHGPRQISGLGADIEAPATRGRCCDAHEAIDDG